MTKKGASSSKTTDHLFDVSTSVDAGQTSMPAQDLSLLEKARDHWQTGEWASLAALATTPLDAHPDKAKLALLAAVGLAQEGDLATARRFAVQAKDWGCDRQLIARIFIGGAYNSLGRAASLHDDEDNAMRYFEASVAAASPRGDTARTARTRNIHEKARLGLLPEAAELLGLSIEEFQNEPARSASEGRKLQVQVELINSVLARTIARSQLPLEQAAPRPDDTLDNHAASQLGQDLWVLERTNNKTGGFFVEFGATDGVIFSNSLLLEKEFGWTGICAEPNPDFYEKLETNRACIVSPDCITGTTGEKVTFVMAAEYGTIDRYIASDNHAQRRQAFKDAGDTIELVGISLDDFLTKHGAPRDIDYLSIDTEGSEYDILAPFPFEKWNIRLITVEHNYTPHRTQIRNLLEAQGYIVTETKFDDWYEKPQ
jgi:FkbM family methyltransferase